jgi:hypothetical protein
MGTILTSLSLSPLCVGGKMAAHVPGKRKGDEAKYDDIKKAGPLPIYSLYALVVGGGGGQMRLNQGTTC